jgi:hypothetical protein
MPYDGGFSTQTASPSYQKAPVACLFLEGNAAGKMDEEDSAWLGR